MVNRADSQSGKVEIQNTIVERAAMDGSAHGLKKKRF
jgi:hypothetical protein